MNNKQAGNKFEREFCEQLARDNFWAHFMGGSKNGQPADIIAVRNERAYLIDAKDCQNDRFAFSRIEDNQHMAMRKWELCGNNQGLFALKTSKGVYMLRYGMVQALEIAGVKSLDILDMKKHCVKYEKWEEEV
jgi:Holliday junction resolvase